MEDEEVLLPEDGATGWSWTEDGGWLASRGAR